MKTTYWKRAGFAVLGAAGGFAYYYFIGCASGTCPISSNPYISTAYGALLGVLLYRSPATKATSTTGETDRPSA